MNKLNSKPKNATIPKPTEPKAESTQGANAGDEVLGFFAGKGAITGDVVSPALSEEEWGDLC